MTTAELLPVGMMAAVNLLAVGAAWGNLRAGQQSLRADMDGVKRTLGMQNGQPTRFITREELVLLREHAEKTHADMDARSREERERIWERLREEVQVCTTRMNDHSDRLRVLEVQQGREG